MTTHAPYSQGKYQVRFDQGDAGLARIAGGADIVVWVDALEEASGSDQVAPPVFAVPEGAAVVAASLTDASVVARWILAEQERLGRRAYLAIVAARDGGGFPVPDLLAAGALIDALIDLGIDDTSPEAAFVSSGFAGLKRAVRHLTSASAQGRQAAVDGATAERLNELATLGSITEVGDVRVLRAGV
ncbi:hypothetical protein ET445_06910 [Agromyces protaetiae]|uniref:2-phosphosulfolactate phosphatase n=1 Tax=Agromyces protaetiae TaxID=2509455 RepID=A0A4P6FRG1_9MICO|nr:hypothetical protein [Agromyces protaetiae]QAY73118.1 hypothetical protein ET445_06910 [Agromyces protaetiae]